MFTGLIEEIGTLLRVDRQKLTIDAHKVLENTQRGDSIAVNGICLTVIQLSSHQFNADLSQETLQRTGLHQARIGERVNLERALQVGDRLGGHYVLGHVDGIARVMEIRSEGNGKRLVLRVPTELLPYLPTKGSVSLDGISLTIADQTKDTIAIAVIPETWRNTTLAHKRIGSSMNIEIDPLARYVNQESRLERNARTKSLLYENGFIR